MCSQPSASIASAVATGIVEIALHHAVAADEHLAVVGDAHLDPSHGSPAVVAMSSNESPGRDSVTLPASVSP